MVMYATEQTSVILLPLH